MIITLTLNPCFDRTLTIDRLTPGSTHQVRATKTEVGGKGINVSTVLKNLGIASHCTGVLPENGSKLIEGEMNRRGIAHHFSHIQGEVRTNVKVFDSTMRNLTEFNEKGQLTERFSTANLIVLIEHMYLSSDKNKVLVLSGSVPNGMARAIYADLINKFQPEGVDCFLDASGEALLAGVQACPTLIKPNLAELETISGHQLSEITEIIRLAKEQCQKGIRFVCVSMGSEGAILTDGEETYFASGLTLDVRGIQGAGDSLLAGIIAAWQQSLSMPDMLRWGMAAAAGSIEHPGTGLCTQADFDRLLPQVQIKLL